MQRTEALHLAQNALEAARKLRPESKDWDRDAILLHLAYLVKDLIDKEYN